MPTSDAARRPWLRRAVVALLIACGLVLADVGLTLALEPYGSNSASVWHEYRASTASGARYDTLVIGSSVAQDALQPRAIDEGLDATSFSLASPGQSLKSALDSLEIALEDGHPVRRVILGTSYTQLFMPVWPNSNMAFTQALVEGQPLAERVTRYAGLCLSDDFAGKISSLLFLAPFTYDHVDYTPSAIAANVTNRLECATPLEAEARIDPTWKPLGKGYANHTGWLLTEAYAHTGLGRQKLEDQKAVPGETQLTSSEMESLERICALCEREGIGLVVMIPPHPTFQVQSMAGFYAADMAEVQRVVESHGGLYLDFNFAHADTYVVNNAEFTDETHLNMPGAERFAPALASVVGRAEAGEDVSGLFWSYAQWDEWEASLADKGITFTYFEATPEEDGATYEAFCYAAPSCAVEYEYAVLGSDGTTWEVVRDWSEDGVCTLPVKGYGTAQVRVSARQVGSTEAERTHVQTITYLGA